MHADKLLVKDVHPPFIANLRDAALLSDEEIGTFLSFVERTSIRKKDFILRAGEICRYYSLVNKGCMRRYTIDKNGKEVIINFAVEGWWVGDLESLENKSPTAYYIQALEDCEILRIPRLGFLRLIEVLPKFKAYHEAKVSRSYFTTLKKLAAAQSATPEEKYQALLHEHPQLFQRVPQHYIACYLGIEPESLSRLRKRLAEKGHKS